MMTLEEMGVEIKGAAAMVCGFQELFRGIVSEESLDLVVSDELYDEAYQLFGRALKEMLCNKTLLLWSDTDGADVHILDSEEQASMWAKEAERLFEEYPLKPTDDLDFDKFNQMSRFTRIITVEQLERLAGYDFSNPNCYVLDECGLSFVLEDTAAITRARAAGEI